MASIHPLRALRYTPKAGEIASLATLPYDVIPPALESQYKARSPFNFAHLILPNGDYTAAAARLAEWKGQGILARDTEESLFVYQQTFPAPGSGELLVRRGFVGLGDTEDYGKNVFRHERTLSGPKEDRFRLLQATQVQFDSIFMLFPDAEGAIDARLADICATPAHLDYNDHEKTHHQLWRVTDPSWIAAIQLLMADKPVLIADGHHRYETALRQGQPRTLMTFVSLHSPGLRCFATHRIVHSLENFNPQSFLAALPNVAPGLDPLVSPPGHIRIAIQLPSGAYHTDIPAPPDALNVAVLQHEILTSILGLTPEKVTAGGHLRYKRTREEALAEVLDGRAQIAFLLEDLPIDGMARVSFAGEVLPQKSTYFYPKLASGLVMLELETMTPSYTCHRTPGPPDWSTAQRSARFADMVTGEPGLLDTRAAALWDDQNLYVHFWIEEPFLEAHQTERDSLIFLENDVELFIDGGGCYYEFEINALGTIYEVFFIWQDAYHKFPADEFDIHRRRALSFAGDDDRSGPTFWRGAHPRGARWAFRDWDFPGLQSAVTLHGHLNDRSRISQGWEVDLTLPWAGMAPLANGRSLPPQPGDTWNLFFGRFEKLIIHGNEIQPHPAWCLSPHGILDTHRPDRWTPVVFA